MVLYAKSPELEEFAAAARSRVYNDEVAVLATMHRKEQAIAPILERFLGLRLQVTTDLDTDTFGTFSREVERAGTQVDAARAKIRAAFALHPDLDIGLASEGTFGPHPPAPFCAMDREIVVLIDRTAGLELIGHHATLDTNYGHAIVTHEAAGLDFAERSGFPGHGVILMACRDRLPAPDLALVKDIASWDDLKLAIRQAIASSGSAFVETDMRAHRNPRRMRAIRRAAIDLARNARSCCPRCNRPGFVVTERLSGLPCSWCGVPSNQPRAEVLSCTGCELRVERTVGPSAADPAHCQGCNP